MMKNLQEFQVPVDGEIPVCEINSRVHTISSNLDFTNISAFTTAVEKHPRIRVSHDSLHPPATGDEARALFLPVSVPLLKQLAQIYHEHGLVEALQTVARHRNNVVSRAAVAILRGVAYSEKIKNRLLKKREEGSAQIIGEFAQTRLWESSPIRCFAWHPYCTRIAVAGLDDIVRIYCGDSNFVPLLKCKQQKNVSCMAWRPMSMSELAVGGENEIIIWNVDPASVISRPSISNAIILHRIKHRCITSITWSPRGDVLVSAATEDMEILVWDVELDRTSSLKRPGYSGNVLVRFSPTADKLFTASTGLVFRVFNCKNWQPERWTVQSGRIQAACWSNTSDFLIFATTDEPILYGLTFQTADTVFVAHSEAAANLSVPLYDLSRVDLDGIIVGGLVQAIDIDPKDRHLAVLFRDSNCVVIFNVGSQPFIQLIPNSLVTGLPEERPVLIEFQKNFQFGSCLTIAWSSGRLQYYPIVYNDRVIDFNKSGSLNRTTLHTSVF